MLRFPYLIRDTNSDLRLLVGNQFNDIENLIDRYFEVLNIMIGDGKIGWLNIESTNYVCYKKVLDNFVIMVPFLVENGNLVTIADDDELFAKGEIESSCDQLIHIREHFIDEYSEDINLLVHDLRRISAEIYHSSIEARRNALSQNFVLCQKSIENIMNLHSILKIRTDIVDIIGNRSSIINRDEVFSAIEKVEYVFNTLRHRADSENKNIKFRYSSISKVNGPNALEIITYILLDNAIKYSPSGHPISCSLIDGDDDILLSVESLGPKIDENERDLIFTRKFRGENAVNTGQSGTGYGLFILNSLVVNSFKGSLLVNQSANYIFNNDDLYYYLTRFEIRLPIYRESSA